MYFNRIIIESIVFFIKNSDYDDYPRISRNRRRSPSRSRRSRSRSPPEAPKTAQYIPIAVPYYQPQAPAQAPATSTNPNSGLSFLQSQLKKALVDDNPNHTVRQIFEALFSNISIV